MGDKSVLCAKGDELFAQAQKKLAKSPGMLASVFGKSKDVLREEAAELYVQASHQYKGATQWNKAASALQAAARLHAEAKQIAMAADLLDRAAGLAQKEFPDQALELYDETIRLFKAEGKTGRVAKTAEAAAEIADKRLGDAEAASKFYKMAIEAYTLEKSHVTAAQCKNKMAAILATAERYDEAVETFEEVGLAYAEDARMKLTARVPFFMAMLCRLAALHVPGAAAGDAPAAEIKERYDARSATLAESFERYQTAAPVFDSSTREWKLIDSCIKAVEAKDADAFADAVQEFEAVLPLDDVGRRLVMRARSAVKSMSADIT